MRVALLIAASSMVALALPPSAKAQVVQLPTYRQFTIGTSVLVPDRGSAYLGGVDRAAYGSSRRGLSRSIGSSVGSTGVSVHATIIDHPELDRAVLAEAAARRGATHDVLGRDLRAQQFNPAAEAVPLGNTPPAAANPAEAIRRKAAFLSRHTVRDGQR